MENMIQIIGLDSNSNKFFINLETNNLPYIKLCFSVVAKTDSHMVLLFEYYINEITKLFVTSDKDGDFILIEIPNSNLIDENIFKKIMQIPFPMASTKLHYTAILHKKESLAFFNFSVYNDLPFLLKSFKTAFVWFFNMKDYNLISTIFKRK